MRSDQEVEEGLRHERALRERLRLAGEDEQSQYLRSVDLDLLTDERTVRWLIYEGHIRVRLEAVQKLTENGLYVGLREAAEVVKVLENALYRDMAEDVLVQVGSKSFTEVWYFLKRMLRGDHTSVAKEYALRVVARIGRSANQALPLLDELRSNDNPDTRTRLAATQAYREVHGRAAEPGTRAIR